MTKKALICGVSGQDGAYLARLLLDKGYNVYGTSRDAQLCSFGNLARLGIHDQVHLLSMSLVDFRSVLQTLSKVQPEEVYNLAGQSSVGLSFEQPVETLESHAMGCLNLLESIRFLNIPVRLYNACSGECFGDTGDHPATEDTQFRPRSPYAVAKAAAFWEVANYREAYNIFACSGILFNHESPLRPERFVTKKIITAVCRIAAGNRETLQLGNLEIKRDWGWAPNYVEAMWRMLQQELPDDFVIATGMVYSLADFVELAFNVAGLNWRNHVKTDHLLLRPSEIMSGFGNPAKAKKILGWQPQFFMQDVVKMMIDDEIKLHSQQK